ncbi:MAG: hypothetical protein LC781_22335 [Actinobacteria bacterium]|nr:hypothetical protein [Actinomycetota bacterium]
MNVSASSLIRWSGLAAVLAGVVLILVELMELFAIDLENLGTQAATGTFAFWAGLTLLSMVLLSLGLVGIYSHQLEAAGVLGLAGFLVAFFGTALTVGASWALLFIVPLAPAVLGTPWFELSFLLFALGWVLFGVAILRARVFPRAAGVLVPSSLAWRSPGWASTSSQEGAPSRSTPSGCGKFPRSP